MHFHVCPRTSMMREILVQVLEHGVGLELPQRATEGSSGVDLRAAVTGDVIINPGDTALIPTGLIVSIPQGFEWQIRPRSGNALRHGITVLNSPGTVDSDYRGEVGVILANLGHAPFNVRRGDRIAQAVLAPVFPPVLTVVHQLEETDRGEGGFGHTGKQ